jgi:hypothetical protein
MMQSDRCRRYYSVRVGRTPLTLVIEPEHSHDSPIDLADASLVIAAKETENGRFFSTDQRDFRTYR